MSDPETTRHLILEQAERQFRHFGYAKTTMADVAKACKMSSANVYRFFPSKGALIEGIASIWLDEVEVHARDIAQRAQPASERFRAYVLELHQRTVARYQEEAQVHELCSLAVEQNFTAVEQYLARMAMILEGILRDGCDSGEFFIDDVPMAARVIRTSTMQFHHPYLVAEMQQTLQKNHTDCLAGIANTEETVEFFLAYLRRPAVVDDK